MIRRGAISVESFFGPDDTIIELELAKNASPVVIVHQREARRAKSWSFVCLVDSLVC